MGEMAPDKLTYEFMHSLNFFNNPSKQQSCHNFKHKPETFQTYKLLPLSEWRYLLLIQPSCFIQAWRSYCLVVEERHHLWPLISSPNNFKIQENIRNIKNHNNHLPQRHQPLSRCSIFPAFVKIISGKMDTWRASASSSSTTASTATH